MTSLIKKAGLIVLGGLTVLTFFLVSLPPANRVHEDDYNRLIDIPFDFQHIPVCRNKHNFIILVHTSPNNIGRRNILRQTWASTNETDIDIFFLIGKSEKVYDRPKLEEEILLHKNFIQGDFLDTYHNLTYKHVMGLKYVFYHCPNIEYIIKVDDDIFVNTHVLDNFFKMLKTKDGIDNKILCTLRDNDPVPRIGKWAVDIYEFPHGKYPPFCVGFAIIYTKKALEMLYNAAQKMRYYWIDDVHVSGLVANEVGVKHVDISQLSVHPHELFLIMTGKFKTDIRPVLFGPPDTKARNIQKLHAFIGKYGRKISIMDYLT